jgi:hypothetical protein
MIKYLSRIGFWWLIVFVLNRTANAALRPGQIPTPEDLGVFSNVHISQPYQLLYILTRIVTWIYTIFFIIAVAFILLAAFQYLMSKKPDDIQLVHRRLIYAAVAIAIALLSSAFVFIVQNFLINSTVIYI